MKELTRKCAITSLLAMAGLLLTIQHVSAAYSRTQSSPVHIAAIYTNEYGSPFVYTVESINSACAGFYLYDITASQPAWELRNNKMAVLLAAKMADKRVTLDYFFDPGINGWSACYIEGIQIVE